MVDCIWKVVDWLTRGSFRSQLHEAGLGLREGSGGCQTTFGSYHGIITETITPEALKAKAAGSQTASPWCRAAEEWQMQALLPESLPSF